jgi:hypothetical protein
MVKIVGGEWLVAKRVIAITFIRKAGNPFTLVGVGGRISPLPESY